MDRLLRAAEHEAAQIREDAERRAAVLLTKAHAEIARHDQERRQEWEERETALAAAEERVATELTAAREQAARLLAAADAEARRLRDQAQTRAREMVEAAEQAIAQARRDAGLEIEQLTRTRDGARGEIQRLLRTLDGIREALAYELDAGGSRARTRQEQGEPADGRAASLAGIGRRRGDLHRTRHSGLIADDSAE